MDARVICKLEIVGHRRPAEDARAESEPAGSSNLPEARARAEHRAQSRSRDQRSLILRGLRSAKGLPSAGLRSNHYRRLDGQRYESSPVVTKPPIAGSPVSVFGSGSFKLRVSRARCKALLIEIVEPPSSVAASAAAQPSTSHSRIAARWRGGSCWMAATKAPPQIFHAIASRPAYHRDHGGMVKVASSLRRATKPSRSCPSQAFR